MLTLFEVLVIAGVFMIIFCLQRLHPTWMRLAERKLGRMSRRRGLAVALVGLLALAGNATLTGLGGVPQPVIQDEFSYLLAADTFAHGRLTNPTHPLWVHFETIHIIQQPTYASKYPPAQGLMLALGQVMSGYPIVGVWISTGLACAAICWMLLAWLPPRWAVLGGLLAALHPGILLDWGQSYWGGAVAVIGGALVFGALRRLRYRPRTRDALLMGIGLAVLANSRPYEGLVVSLPVAAVLLIWMMGKYRPPTHIAVTRLGLPLLGILALTGGAMGVYNWRVTGDPLSMPYQVHEATYAIAPPFLWQRLRPEPPYRHQALWEFYTSWDVKSYLAKRALPILGFKTLGLFLLGGFEPGMCYLGSRPGFRYLPLVLTVPLVLLPWMWREPWSRFALLTCGVLVIALLMETWVMPHYAAPIMSLCFALMFQAMRHLRLWRWSGRPIGQSLVWALVVICVITFLGESAQELWMKRSTHSEPRARLLTQLQNAGGRHLVIIRYGPRHSIFQEWVYNEAEIDRATVVWAREMDAAYNRTLLEYFKDRQVWLAEVGKEDVPLKLGPYPKASGP
jgi:hypothetical protein